ncbi:hypothetical protein O6H91_11G109200 [Diphasiastrum complanatum]|nr:hypothetical protein O6H91_11G109200 [Diphasiastrum complanatum]
MQDASAINVMQYYPEVQPIERGRNVYIQHSLHLELTSADQTSSTRRPSNDQIMESTKKAQSKGKEPYHTKAHWDFVLDEMSWLAKDFERERKWKLGQARKVALRLSKTQLDVETKELKRQKEEEQRLRRIASNIAKDVKKFWTKVEKLVFFKYQLQQEERQRKLKEKNLDFFVGQAQRYTDMLLRKTQVPVVLKPTESLHLISSAHDDSDAVHMEDKSHSMKDEVESAVRFNDGWKTLEDEQQKVLPLAASNFVESPTTPKQMRDLQKSYVSLRSEGLDEEFVLKDEDDSDDEATIEADEALITDNERREELDALQKESELPLEEILKRYYSTERGLEDSMDSEESSQGSGHLDDSKETDSIDRKDVFQMNDANRIGEENASPSTREDSKTAGTIPPSQLSGIALGAVSDVSKNSEEGSLSILRPLWKQTTMSSSGDRAKMDDGEHYFAARTIGQEEDKERELQQQLPPGYNYLSHVQMDSGEVDDDTGSVLAKVSEAAKRRGERLQMRASKKVKHHMVEEHHSFSAKSKINEPNSTFIEAGSKEQHQRISSLDKGEFPDAHAGIKISAPEGTSVSEIKYKSTGVSPSLRNENESDLLEVKTSEDRLADAAAAAQSAQPTGYTFSTTKVWTKHPFLLKHSLREYQHIGLDWLVNMYEKRLNGILADEMGLGKTIMTIALLAHLACEKGIWGPHLIVVPTSVMLNWETEFMKWCPAFKVLTYFGTAKERKVKRQGWSKFNSFHICITTYRLVTQDAKAFRRKKWKYLILDEAHLIKNWKSQRWQTLLNFNSKRRILLTGTPLQNDLMELWSLMHFLMPHVFQSHQEFRDWFCNPISGMVEGQEKVNMALVDRLHDVLRPFLLRRLKQDVEKQLPQKHEHVIRCRLSKRQRNLYEDFMASSDTQATLTSGNFLGLINVLMQLRKVCNHPDLFEGRPIISSFDMEGIDMHQSSAVCSVLEDKPFLGVNLEEMNLQISQLEFAMMSWEADEVARIATPAPLIEEIASTGADSWKELPSVENQNIFAEIQAVLHEQRQRRRRQKAAAFAWLNMLRCSNRPVYGCDLRRSLLIEHPVYNVHEIKSRASNFLEFSSVISDIVLTPLMRCEQLSDFIEAFVVVIPAARAPWPVGWCSHLPFQPPTLKLSSLDECLTETSGLLQPLRRIVVRRQLFFPDRRLLQFDCGKLQELAALLRRLKSEGHRALIFTQMTKMLDVLESFINMYGYTYMRLDGSTKPEQRQILMQRFNTNPKIFLFILSTRSGGVGINLVGADTVIFYDSDWNPAMDQQAQDRCHRIGQTREVNIYRLVSESTIEENILKKANKKRFLDDLVIQSGSYNTEFFKKLDATELFSVLKGDKSGNVGRDAGTPNDVTRYVGSSDQILSSAQVEAALKSAEDEADYLAMKKVEQEEAADYQEFTEEGDSGNADDEEYIDDLDEGRVNYDNSTDPSVVATSKVEHDEERGVQVAHEIIHTELASMSVDNQEDMDMLLDIRQLKAAAVSAGRGSMSFEDQLKPIDRYAMRFLEFWDQIIEPFAIESETAVEEKEWELERLERLKEEQEAEMDEDNESMFYETRDVGFADEYYWQHVEFLAQQQLTQSQLEWEMMQEEMNNADKAVAEAAAAVIGAENSNLKSRFDRKVKKAKFKSLKKGSLGVRDNIVEDFLDADISVSNDEDLSGEEWPSDPLLRTPSQRKRKAPKLLEEEMIAEVLSKKMKREQTKDNKERGQDPESKGCHQPSNGYLDEEILEAGNFDPNQRQGSLLLTEGSAKTKFGTKFSIIMPPLKKGALFMLEKEKKRDLSKSKKQLPPADPWMPLEDAILSACVHEYGGNWLLASETLAGMYDGSLYRGRYRHPVHCRERFRQLHTENVAPANADPNSEKSGVNATRQLKVTQEHTRQLLAFLEQLPDNELLLQRHFISVLHAWHRAHSQGDRSRSNVQPKGITSPVSSSFVRLTATPQDLSTNQVSIGESSKGLPEPALVADALAQADKFESKSNNAAEMAVVVVDEQQSDGATLSSAKDNSDRKSYLDILIEFEEGVDVFESTSQLSRLKLSVEDTSGTKSDVLGLSENENIRKLSGVLTRQWLR